MIRKPFDIAKAKVWQAWKRVKASGGGAGSDGIDLASYETTLSKRLYRVWNRLSSGSYFPSPVRQVAIPKASGGERLLHIPTIDDRVAQATVKAELEKKLEPLFHPNSYGYRPKKSAIDAVRQCRSRCFRRSWVIDLDIASFFDTIPHDLLLKGLERHVEERWQTVAIRRILRAPVQTKSGVLFSPLRGIAQGSVLSPLLANVYLHYGLDRWLERRFPHVWFERFADDVVLHCASKQEAEYVLSRVRTRFAEIGLKVNEQKTKIVYCGDPRRRPEGGDCPQRFTFLGYEFKPREVKARGDLPETMVTPAVGTKAKSALTRKLKKLRIEKRTQCTLEQLADLLNPVVRGWCLYFGHFRPSEMDLVLTQINTRLLKWVEGKYRVRGRRAIATLQALERQNKDLFCHWRRVGARYAWAT